MSTRRIQVRGTDQRVVLGVGSLTGVGLALDGLSPTGATITDWLMLIAVAMTAVWASASAPWWALSGLAAVGAAMAPPIAALAVGGGVFLLSLGIGMMRSSQPTVRAVVSGASLLVLATAGELIAFGVNTLIAVAAVSVVAWLGLMRRSRRVQRRSFQVGAMVLGVVAVGSLGLLAALVASRPDLSEGNRTAREGLRQLKAGEFDEAQQSFDLAAGAFARAESDLTAPWTWPSLLVPVVAQHTWAGADISTGAARTSRTIERQLGLVDLDSLRIVDGRIDLDAVRDLRAPMRELQGALDDLDEAVADADNAWLARPVQRRIDDLAAEVAEQRSLGDKAVAALEVAPAILGAEGERVYFVMFTTPAEARGQGGFMGNWAELSFNDGEVVMTDFGRTGELNRGGTRPRWVTGPADWLARYGPMGFQTGPGGSVGEVPWSNITMSPFFDSTAQVVAELYPQSGGRTVDGVISLDIVAIEQLVGLVGPIDVRSTGTTLTGTNTTEFLGRGQYQFETSDRIDILETVALEVFERILSGAIADPLDLGRALAGPASERRVLAWAADDSAQSIAEAAGLSGVLFDGGETSAFSVRAANASGNKIDAYLSRRVCLTASERPTATVTLTNEASADGLRDIVIGNLIGLPDGYNRSYVSWYSTMPVNRAWRDGREVGVFPQLEQGVHATSLYVEIPPGESVDLTFEMSRPLTSTVVASPQPLLRPELWAFGDCTDPEFRELATPTSIATAEG